MSTADINSYGIGGFDPNMILNLPNTKTKPKRGNKMAKEKMGNGNKTIPKTPLKGKGGAAKPGKVKGGKGPKQAC